VLHIFESEPGDVSAVIMQSSIRTTYFEFAIVAEASGYVARSMMSQVKEVDFEDSSRIHPGVYLD
jgi:hypothetical protein